MTIVHMSEKGQVVVPKAARDELGLGLGSPLRFVLSKSGQLVFQPIHALPKKSLVSHLKALKGLELPERKHLCPPRV